MITEYWIPLGLLLATTAAPSQDLAQYCRSLYKPHLGDYAELELRAAGAPRPTRMRFAVVDTERVNGVTGYWFEVATIDRQPGAGTTVVQLLVPHYPFNSQDIESYVLQLPGRLPMRIPVEMVRQAGEMAAGSQIGWEEGCRSARDLGTTSIQVSAGRFEARHLRTTGKGEGEIWLSARVPFGILKFTSADGSSMELRRYGTGAKSLLTGTPVDVQVSNSPRDSL